MIQIRLISLPALNAGQLLRCIYSRTLYTVKQYSTGRTVLVTTPNSRPNSLRYRCTSSTCTRIVDTNGQSVSTEDRGASIETEFDWAYLCNPNNLESIRKNIAIRKGVGDIDKLHALWSSLHHLEERNLQASQEHKVMKEELIRTAADIPNRTHPLVPVGDEKNAKEIALHGKRTVFSPRNRIRTAVELGTKLEILRTQDVGVTTGPRTYYLLDELALLSDALVNYTLDVVLDRGFELISVPDLVPTETVEGCGFKTTGERSQVYKLDKTRHGDLCLAGTGEIPIAGFFQNKILKRSTLPRKLTTVSRCFRAETSEVEREQGLYRVHQFTKVEMFGVTADESGRESEELLEEILNIQTTIFNGLGLHFRVLDMPSEELGAPAYRKYDMETWLPAKEFWGEISSASNCTDYQSRRLGIRYSNDNNNNSNNSNDNNNNTSQQQDKQLTRFCHTVNGTGCAVPRLIIAILENCQQPDGSVHIPTVLQPYMQNKTCISRPVNARPPMKYIRMNHAYKKEMYTRERLEGMFAPPTLASLMGEDTHGEKMS